MQRIFRVFPDRWKKTGFFSAPALLSAGRCALVPRLGNIA